MNNRARQGTTDAQCPQFGRFSVVLHWCLCVLFMLLSPGLMAQDQVPDQARASETVQNPAGELENELLDELPVVTVTLPDSHQMALALATPGLREQALLDLAVAANVLSRAGVANQADHAALAQNFLDDRDWLQMLVGRYGWVQPRSSVLDPAAWLVLDELQQHDIENMALVFPGRSSASALVYQVFQRAGERLAVANLPILLLEVEADVFALWDAFLQLTGSPGSPDTAWKAVELAWFTDRQMPIPPVLEESDQDQEPVIESIPLAMSNLVLSTVDVRPPDSRALVQLRYALLSAVPEPAAVENTQVRDRVRDTLYLASLIDGLHAGLYFEFSQGLLAITSNLLELPTYTDEAFSLADWLVEELPAISAHYAVDFARVDPRLNAAIAASYEVLLVIAKSREVDTAVIDEPELTGSVTNEPEAIDPGVADPDTNEPQATDFIPISDPGIDDIAIKASRAILADAVAQLALLIPDMGYYFDTPVRDRIVEEIDICISIAVALNDDGYSSMTRPQFDACMETLLQLADGETRLAELAGNINGPFTTDTLRRELSVTPWQRINYGIGYLHEHYSTDCKPPASALPNPLEWAVLATTMAWFAEDGPVYFQTPENEARLVKIRNIGEQLILGLAEQSACLAGTGSGINDPVNRGMVDYELALRELDLGIKSAEADFRAQRLSPDADISLQKDALQRTAYRPDDLVIEPCNQQAVCEMSGSLSTTRALIGLFPDQYLIAEQTGMGQIEICYRNMEWVQRRSELVRPDDENVANYFGHLGFDLVGRYIEKDQVSDIFAFRFTSPEEHHYLFAQTSEEVLSDSCPVEWVGSRVVTPLRHNRSGIVPDRLTYLAASRKLPSRMLQNNWDRGTEWRDWFVTGIGVTPLEVPPGPEIKTRLNQHLQFLYQAEQAEIYQRVLLPSARNSEGDDVSLFDEMSQVSIAKAMIRMQMMLFYSESLLNSDPIRMAIAGDAGLLEGRTLRRFREENIALTSVNGIALQRLNALREVWAEQPEAVRRQGSVPASLMHALTRINILYRQFFTSQPEPLQEIEVTAKLQGQN